MPSFDKAHRAVHVPDDRRVVFRLQPRYVVWLVVVIAIPIALAWLQVLAFGIHSASSPIAGITTLGQTPRGFPVWIRWTHFANIVFLFLLVRSGLSILMDHPRLYWNNDCTPGSEWLRFTPIAVPNDRVWTAKEDARYISPLISLPGYRHTIGMGRSWHFITDYGFIFTGVIYVVMLLVSGQWPRLVPTSWEVFPYAWQTFVHYATFHFPVEPNGFYAYNAIQQLTYFGVVFIMAPLSILTGISMSPAVDGAFPWYPRIFGGRQGGRSIHFLLLCGYIAFTIVHVSLVIATGAQRNFNHIVLGTNDTGSLGLILGCIGLALVVASWLIAHVVAWRFPRVVQRLHKMLIFPLELSMSASERFNPHERYTRADISPYFWPNGKMPTSEQWKGLTENGFRDYRLRVGGLVANPVELSLDDLRALGHDEHVALHHCIQGWSGIAQWGGISMVRLIGLVKPLPNARVVVFVSFGDGIFGGVYYDTQRLEDVVKPECLLAYEMNDEVLPQIHGAPLRLRVENQLGFKMVKWISEIRFEETAAVVGKGFGGKNEDDEYFDLLPYI
ncbi:MAG: molybdopterin-dependent oxidoreductase [Candidatus Eremiobacteraeota bacterium]|nr:molybdopterin-dependent oxidoreductase [Candidatus Eremiobacteraeota bacterium]